MEQLREQCEVVLGPLLEWMAAHGSESYKQSSPLVKARGSAHVCQWILNGTHSRQHYAAVLGSPDELAKVIASVGAKSARSSHSAGSQPAPAAVGVPTAPLPPRPEARPAPPLPYAGAPLPAGPCGEGVE
eukprot:3587196-Alexandrium_andersonii.AAC.1